MTKRNFKWLVEIYRKYKEHGLEILAFPCISFHQEYDTNDEVQRFATTEFNIGFPLLGLIDCNGERDDIETHPLFRYLTSQLPNGPKGSNVEWNFAKFLIDDKGIPIARFANKESLDVVENAIIGMLHK